MLIRRPETSAVARSCVHAQNRYIWGAGTSTHFEIPKGYPDRLLPGSDIIKPRITLTEGEFSWKIGWSHDGLHWVLFGLDDTNPVDRITMSEFPTFLRLACTTKLDLLRPGETAPVLDSLRRAFALRETA